jgi:streptomycin 6-kinase
VDSYIQKWSLENVTALASTFTSEVYTAKQGDALVVLKVLNKKGRVFEAKGASVLRCFDGHGAVRLLEADDSAHLLEYVDGPALSTIVASGDDLAATEIICGVVEKIHSYHGLIPQDLITMEQNFQSLFKVVTKPSAETLYRSGARVAEYLIATEQEKRLLHGDIHHENVLKSSRRGWLAIDPQSLFGERTYDVANVFYNPIGFSHIAASTESILQRRDTFANRLGLDAKRVLQYAFAYGCLSACWCVEDGQSPESTLKIARQMFSLLEG